MHSSAGSSRIRSGVEAQREEPQVSTRSGLRLFVLRVLVFSILATLLGRLWYLQVYASERSTPAAQAHPVRARVEPATRGMIYDSSGRPIVENRTAMVISVNRAV